MVHRFTIKELKEMSDEKIMQIILSDRSESLTNPYAPLTERIKRIHNRLDNETLVAKVPK
jgi:hypothetical protein